jgi:hypothetical protein
VCVVTTAANRNVAKGFLLVSDANTLVSQAGMGNVLFGYPVTPDDQALENSLCSSPDAKAINQNAGWIH